MTDVALFTSSGGLVAEALIQDLRADMVGGDVKFLADIGGFVDLAGKSPTKAEYESDLEAAFRSAQALWAAYDAELEAGMEVGRLRERLLRPLFELLGFAPAYQRSHLTAGDGTWAISHLGWDQTDAPPISMVADADLDVAAGRRRCAHDELQGYLNAASQTWGLLTNGRVLRLLRYYHHSRSRGYVQFDLAAIFKAASLPDFLALWRLCHASRFQVADTVIQLPSAPASGDDQEEKTDETREVTAASGPASLLERLYNLSVSAGVAAGKRLQPQVRRAIEELANGVLEANPELRERMLAEATFGRELYRELLLVLYRTLFLLFAEQRGMLRGATALYEDTYSISRLRTLADTAGVEGRRFDLWEGMKATFSAFSDPDRAAALGVYPYNGQLFDQTRTALLGAARCPNWRVLAAIGALTTMQVDAKMSLHVDYRHLGVEELGTVYESLLDYTLKIAETPTVSANRPVAAGHAYLADLAAERGDMASYYTPPALVSLVLDRALIPLIEERLADAGASPAARERALLDLRVIDPACGSGAFLVGVIDRLGDEVARTRSNPVEPSDEQFAFARRDVLTRCIYGVDKDPFAVELCKVALWIHCAVPDAPLSFLDAHVVCGDSLIGWPLLGIPDAIPSEAYGFAATAADDKKVLAAARKANDDDLAGTGTLWRGIAPAAPSSLRLPSILEAPEDSYLAVRQKADAYREYLDSDAHRELCRAANLWTTAFFWTAAQGAAPITGDYRKALGGHPDEELADAAERVAALVAPMHWTLTFPDIRERGGFDLVCANPPWEEFQNEELEFFRESAPTIAALPTKERKAAIDQLVETDPGLHARWVEYQAVQARQAYYAKNSGRFTRTSGKANTYVMFTELAAALTREHGRTGILVKTGLAIDLAQNEVWDALLRRGRVCELRDIVNGGPTGSTPIFPGVDAKERYIALVLGPERTDRTDFGASMMNMSLEEAASRDLVPWSRDRLRLTCPATGTLLSARYAWEIDLATELQDRWQTLDFDRTTSPEGANPWELSFTQLFNSSTGQRWFHRREALEAEGWVLQADRSFAHPDGRTAVPVFEGQMINRYDHRAKTYEGYEGPNKYKRAPGIPWTNQDQHADPAFEVEPRYWMMASAADERLKAKVGDGAMVAYRDVTSTWRNSRSMKAALLFPTPATDKLPILVAPRRFAAGAVALFNSLIFDFLARLHVPGASLKPWIISQCAAPGPPDLDPECGRLAALLSVTSKKLANAYDLSLHRWDGTERPLLDAEIDARVAHSYKLTRAQYEQLFDHFEVMARVEQANYGEQRTKRLCLEVYDRIAKES